MRWLLFSPASLKIAFWRETFCKKSKSVPPLCLRLPSNFKGIPQVVLVDAKDNFRILSKEGHRAIMDDPTGKVGILLPSYFFSPWDQSLIFLLSEFLHFRLPLLIPSKYIPGSLIANPIPSWPWLPFSGISLGRQSSSRAGHRTCFADQWWH